MGILRNALQDLITSDPKRSAWVSQRMPERIAVKLGRQKAVGVFQDASSSVPAYQAFLHTHDVDPRRIMDFESFQSLPLIDKKGYIVPNSHCPESLCAGGRLDVYHTVARSSGHSGEPLFLPRNVRQDVMATRIFEAMLVNTWAVDRLSTLLLICFDLGMWVAGEMSADVSREIAKKYRSMMVATPGSDIDESLAVIRSLSHAFDQLLILGYPPFLRLLILRGEEQGVEWGKHRVLLFPSGEGYSELWRTRMLERLGATDPIGTILGGFASSEGLLIALESPLSALVRRLADEDDALRRDLFGTDAHADCLVQHAPMGLLIEIVDGEMIMTSPGAAPLVRYNTHDRAGSASFEHVMGTLAAHGYNREQLREAGLADRPISMAPFLFSFGRNDCVSVDGANIYVEAVAPALLEPGMEAIGNWKLAVRERHDGQLQFAILVEHRDGFALDDADAVSARVGRYQQVFTERLAACNPDFRSAHQNNPRCLTPEILIYGPGEGPFAQQAGKVKQQHVHKGDL